MTYFDTEGKENTDTTLDLVKKIAEECDICDIVVASTTGFTAEKAFKTFKNLGVTLTVVGTDRKRFSSDVLKLLEGHDHNVCFSREILSDYPDSASIAFRRFSQGVKVAVQIVVIAAEKQFISTKTDVVSIGKWDTALIIKPSATFTELKVREVICMPR